MIQANKFAPVHVFALSEIITMPERTKKYYSRTTHNFNLLLDPNFGYFF